MSQEGSSNFNATSKNFSGLFQKKNLLNLAPPANKEQGQSEEKQNKPEEIKVRSKPIGQQEKVQLKIVKQNSNQNERSATSKMQSQVVSESTSGTNIFSTNKPAQIKTNLFGASFGSNSIFSPSQPSQENRLQKNAIKKKEDPSNPQPQCEPFTLGGTPATNNSLFDTPKNGGLFGNNNAGFFFLGSKKEEAKELKPNGPQGQETSTVKEEKKETGPIFGFAQQSSNIFNSQLPKNPVGVIFANQPKIQQDKDGNLLNQGIKKNIFGKIIKENVLNHQAVEKPYFKPTDSYIIQPSPEEEKQVMNTGSGQTQEKENQFGGCGYQKMVQKDQEIFEEINERSSFDKNTGANVSKQQKNIIKQQSQPSISSSSEPMITFEQLKYLLFHPQIIKEQVQESKERILKMLQLKYQNNEPIIIKQDTSDIYERKLREAKRKMRHLENENQKLTQDLKQVYKNIRTKRQKLQTLEKETEQFDFETLAQQIKQKQSLEKIQYPSAAEIQQQVDIVLKYVQKHYLGPHQEKGKNQPSEYLLQLNPEHQISRLYQKYIHEIQQNSKLELKQKQIGEELTETKRRIEFKLQNKGSGSKENPFQRNRKELCHFDSEKVSYAKNQVHTGHDIKMTRSEYNPNQKKSKLIQEKLRQLERLRKQNQALQKELDRKKIARDELKEKYERNESNKKPDSSIIMRSQIF